MNASSPTRRTAVRRPALWQISVTTPSDAESATVALFANLLREPAVAYHDEQTDRIEVSVYRTGPVALAAAERTTLRRDLDALCAAAGRSRKPRLRIRRIRHEDWADSWKRHFKPIVVGTRLLVKPSWSRRQGRRGQAVVVLDPGLSFGTGQHPTTGFCLQQLASLRQPRRPQSLWDIGTGSGILAIAGAKLGYGPVHGVDNDPAAVCIARRNARVNRVGRSLRLGRGDITRRDCGGPRRFDVICANLTSDLLICCARRIVDRLAPGGVLIVAGILRRQFATVRTAFEAAGLGLARSQTGGEWRSGTFTAAPPN